MRTTPAADELEQGVDVSHPARVEVLCPPQLLAGRTTGFQRMRGLSSGEALLSVGGAEPRLTVRALATRLLALGGPARRAGDGTDRLLVGEWPGLGPDALHQGRDLMHTTDFRDVLAEVVRDHLGNDRLDLVLPGHEPRPVGLI